MVIMSIINCQIAHQGSFSQGVSNTYSQVKFLSLLVYYYHPLLDNINPINFPLS